MIKLSSKQADNSSFMDFIKTHTPILDALKTTTGQNQSVNCTPLKVPRQLKMKKEDLLLEKAFTTLFHLNVARETRTSFDVEKHRAAAGNQLVKKNHPLNLIYDFQYVAAKTQIKSYVHREPYTIPYNRMAPRIYGRCFLFAQLDFVAQTRHVPNKLNRDFYFLPKGSFIDEFEQMNELALTAFIGTLSAGDQVQFHPTFSGKVTDYEHTAFLLNDSLVLVDTSETIAVDEDALVACLRLFFLQKIKEKLSSTPSLSPVTTVDIYRARFGELECFKFAAYFGESLDDLVDEAVNLLK